MRSLFLVALIVPMWIASACLAEDAHPAAGGAEQEEAGPEHGKLNTPDASPVDPGHFEIELSYGLERVRHFWDNGGHEHSRRMERDSAAGLSVGAGILENLDLHLSSSYLWMKDEENDFNGDSTGSDTGQGFGDLNFDLRYRFLNDTKRHLEMACIVGMTAPTGSRSNEREIGTSQEYWSLGPALVVSKDWGRWTGNADVGFSLPFGNRREDARGLLNGDAALGYQVLPWLQPEIELNYAHEFIAHDADSDVIAATVGLVMPINDRWRLNAGVQQGLWGRNTEKATTYLIALKWAF
jgi:hypothetical protein